jgi:hypothetical protein
MLTQHFESLLGKKVKCVLFSEHPFNDALATYNFDKTLVGEDRSSWETILM